MTFLDYLIEFVLCTGAILSFCVLISVPKKAVPASSLVGGLAYVLYRLIFINFGREILAYFLATVFIALSAEICARIYKKPSTVFIFPGIIPLVPGVVLSRSGRSAGIFGKCDQDGIYRGGYCDSGRGSTYNCPLDSVEKGRTRYAVHGANARRRR